MTESPPTTKHEGTELEFQFQDTQATRKVFDMSGRIRAVAGGTWASKTISILIWLIDYCQSHDNKKCDVVSESYPHLEDGAIKDFKAIMLDRGYWDSNRWNESKHFYEFSSGSKLKFMSVDKLGKAHGPRRDVLFINEANYIDFNIFDQLEVRTNEIIWLDWNPTNEFWYYTEIEGNDGFDYDFIRLTYKDCLEVLPERVVDSMEARKGRTSWWRVYGEGKLGEVEGKIYRGWKIVDEIPYFAQLKRFGLDFGYSNDPTAIVAVYEYNNGYIIDEITYMSGLKNGQIADALLNQEQSGTLVVADSAEPKSIDEIKDRGLNIVGAKKRSERTGRQKSYLNWSINLVQEQKIAITKRSNNVIKEYRNYLWDEDKDGNTLNEPIDDFDHCFAPETVVYTTDGKKRIDELVGEEGYLYTRGGKVRKFYGVRKTREDAEVLNIEFYDGNMLTVTPDHLVLLPSGVWIEAQLLNPMDLIQSVMYEQQETNTNVQWEEVYTSQGRAVLPAWQEVFAQRGVALSQRGNTRRNTYSSQRRRSSQQRDRELGAKNSGRTSKRALDGRASRADGGKRGEKRNAGSEEVALVRRGEGMALATWREDVGRQGDDNEGMQSLSRGVRDTFSESFKVLPSELQNESPTKKVKRITRGRRAITYNLEVEGEHCLWADGVIAHNSMDAIRYAIVSLNRGERDTISQTRPDWISLKHDKDRMKPRGMRSGEVRDKDEVTQTKM